MKMLLFLFSIIFLLKIDYWNMICNNSNIPDLTKWYLSDKYIAKNFARKNGFNVSKIYQYVKYPHQFKNINENYVIKPVDLCDSGGVYLMKNGINLLDNKKYSFKDIQKNLVKLRSEIEQEYYMHNNMFENKIPNTGYIMEELLLDKGNIPSDYKCYTFNGKIWFIVCTYNRYFDGKKQNFNSVWMTREWKPIPLKMIKKGYKYKKLQKPIGLDNMIKKVENLSQILDRHCRIDVYLIKGKVYLGEFTFFTGAMLHSKICNNILGLIWLLNPDVKKNNINFKEILPIEYTILPSS